MEMDFLHAGYLGAIKPWAGSDDTIAIRWYRCLPGAKPFPFPTAFASSVWDTFAGGEQTDIGEVQAFRIWRATNLPHAPPGQEFHGDPSWYLNGIPPEHRNDPPPNCWIECLETDPKGLDIYPEQGTECIYPNF
jgi:hypothetical protein